MPKSVHGQHAVVIGGSMTGLLAARVLSTYFEKVTVVERDTLPSTPEARKGVPQGKHVHLLMIRGAEILEEFFPHIFAELEEAGSLPVSPTEDFHWYHFGYWKLQFPGPLRAHSQSRPLLESQVRRRIEALQNVEIVENCAVKGFLSKPSAVTGVRIERGVQERRGEEENLEADLVVDASGRGSQTAHWLKDLGYPSVEEEKITVNVGYATRIYRQTDQQRNWKLLGIYPWPQGVMKRTGYLFPIEQNAWIVTLSGVLGDHPPADEAGFLEFAQGLAQPDIYNTIKDAEALTPIELYKFPANQRRHYERIYMPQGLVVVGDAACSLNPIYGQGMTLSALGAKTLQTVLAREDLPGVSRRFQKALARELAIPWMLTTSEDFRYAEVQGKRLPGLPIMQAYTRRVSALTATDPFITQSFYEVLNMTKPATTLFSPRIMFPALLRSQKPSPMNVSLASSPTQ